MLHVKCGRESKNKFRNWNQIEMLSHVVMLEDYFRLFVRLHRNYGFDFVCRRFNQRIEIETKFEFSRLPTRLHYLINFFPGSSPRHSADEIDFMRRIRDLTVIETINIRSDCEGEVI